MSLSLVLKSFLQKLIKRQKYSLNSFKVFKQLANIGTNGVSIKADVESVPLKWLNELLYQWLNLIVNRLHSLFDTQF